MKITISNTPPKRSKGQAGQFKVLHTEGKANNGNWEEDSPEKVGEEKPETSENDPDNIER